MRFDILTIFPEIVEPYFSESILKRARNQGLIEVNVHNLRDYTTDKHRTVDDAPYGGGPGMVMKVGPIYRAVKDLRSKVKGQRLKVILLSAKGKQFNQKFAQSLSQLSQLILICGRYEGVDQRVADHIADEVISCGPYVLSGGEIPALAVVEATARLVPGVLGNVESLEEESFTYGVETEYPQYTRPEVFETEEGEKWKVPDVLLSGNHAEIEKWRREHKK